MELENGRSIKEDMITVLKESIKFAFIGIILFFIIGILMFYVVLKIFELDVDTAGILIGLVAAILVVIFDLKKLRTNDKIVECNRRIITKILKKVDSKVKQVQVK